MNEENGWLYKITIMKSTPFWNYRGLHMSKILISFIGAL